MTTEEIKHVYGDEDGYIYCSKCPLAEVSERGGCEKYQTAVDGYADCDGFDKTHKVIQHYLEDTKKDVTDVKEDIISHPSHYTHGGMECIDEMILLFGRQAVKHFCLCNAWKYRKRAMFKNGQEDIDKSDWYIAKYKELDDTDKGGLHWVR